MLTNEFIDLLFNLTSKADPCDPPFLSCNIKAVTQKISHPCPWFYVARLPLPLQHCCSVIGTFGCLQCVLVALRCLHCALSGWPGLLLCCGGLSSKWKAFQTPMVGHIAMGWGRLDVFIIFHSISLFFSDIKQIKQNIQCSKILYCIK